MWSSYPEPQSRGQRRPAARIDWKVGVFHQDLKESKMLNSVSHIALFVPDLQEAERFYKDLFEMELIGREIEKDDGLWCTLPFDKGWEDVKTAGVVLDMTALRKGDFVLALFRGTKSPGQVFAIGLSTGIEDIEAIHDRLQTDIEIEVYQPDRLEFVDPYCITWQIAVEPIFRTAGDFADRWMII
jgi:catechol 2,3-dioxygenase-like lactoylglutathione lyase family enzyme